MTENKLTDAEERMLAALLHKKNHQQAPAPTAPAAPTAEDKQPSFNFTASKPFFNTRYSDARDTSTVMIRYI